MSKKNGTAIVNAVIAGDIYDEYGEMLLIKNGTHVDIQVKAYKGTQMGNTGKIEIIPISTSAKFHQWHFRFFCNN